jgi:hypothetical protein
MALAVKKYEASNPVEIRLLGADTVMTHTNGVADPVEQRLLREGARHGRLWLCLFG